jgi:hypothetical protein
VQSQHILRLFFIFRSQLIENGLFFRPRSLSSVPDCSPKYNLQHFTTGAAMLMRKKYKLLHFFLLFPATGYILQPRIYFLIEQPEHKWKHIIPVSPAEPAAHTFEPPFIGPNLIWQYRAAFLIN